MRFIWSGLIDKYSYKFSYSIMILIQIFTALTFEQIKQYKALYTIWICLIIWTEGGHFAILPAIMSKTFGEYANIMYGISFSLCGMANVLSVILTKFVLDDLGFSFFYYLSGGLNCVAFLILIFVFKEEAF